MSHNPFKKISIIGAVLMIVSAATTAILANTTKFAADGEAPGNGTLRNDLVYTSDGYTCIPRYGAPSCTYTVNSGTTCTPNGSSLVDLDLDTRNNTSLLFTVTSITE